MTIKTGLAVVALGALAIAPAMAQTTPPAAPGSRSTIPEKQGAPMQGRSDSLSNRLSRSGGVISPKGDVDPGMTATAPDPTPHSTPVIPPSATGGNTAK